MTFMKDIILPSFWFMAYKEKASKALDISVCLRSESYQRTDGKQEHDVLTDFGPSRWRQLVRTFRDHDMNPTVKLEDLSPPQPPIQLECDSDSLSSVDLLIQTEDALKEQARQEERRGASQLGSWVLVLVKHCEMDLHHQRELYDIFEQLSRFHGAQKYSHPLHVLLLEIGRLIHKAINSTTMEGTEIQVILNSLSDSIAEFIGYSIQLKSPIIGTNFDPESQEASGSGYVAKVENWSIFVDGTVQSKSIVHLQ